MRSIVPLVAGVVFGAGLTLSGMTDPARVRAFLDLFGAWDPTLAFVMGGALAVMALAWAGQRRMPRPLAAPSFALPTRRDLDPALVGGSALFGLGWGVAGLCPGPALAALVLAPPQALAFVAAMLLGMALHRLSHNRAAEAVSPMRA